MKSIDLGRKYDELSAPCCAPAKSEESKVHYPSLYLDGASELKDLPESGLVTFRFKRVSKSETERDGKKRCSIELEVREIVDAKSGDPVGDVDGEDALDSLAKAVRSIKADK